MTTRNPVCSEGVGKDQWKPPPVPLSVAHTCVHGAGEAHTKTWFACRPSRPVLHPPGSRGFCPYRGLTLPTFTRHPPPASPPTTGPTLAGVLEVPSLTRVRPVSTLPNPPLHWAGRRGTRTFHFTTALEGTFFDSYTLVPPPTDAGTRRPAGLGYSGPTNCGYL